MLLLSIFKSKAQSKNLPTRRSVWKLLWHLPHQGHQDTPSYSVGDLHLQSPAPHPPLCWGSPLCFSSPSQGPRLRIWCAVHPWGRGDFLVLLPGSAGKWDSDFSFVMWRMSWRTDLQDPWESEWAANSSDTDLSSNLTANIFCLLVITNASIRCTFTVRQTLGLQLAQHYFT